LGVNNGNAEGRRVRGSPQGAEMKKWVKLTDLPPDMRLDGLRVRYKKGAPIGHIRSAWGRGIWTTEKPFAWGTVQPWIPPQGKTIADVASDLQVEVER
jgi:hypothetical protein